MKGKKKKNIQKKTLSVGQKEPRTVRRHQPWKIWNASILGKKAVGTTGLATDVAEMSNERVVRGEA